MIKIIVMRAREFSAPKSVGREASKGIMITNLTGADSANGQIVPDDRPRKEANSSPGAGQQKGSAGGRI